MLISNNYITGSIQLAEDWFVDAYIDTRFGAEFVELKDLGDMIEFVTNDTLNKSVTLNNHRTYLSKDNFIDALEVAGRSDLAWQMARMNLTRAMRELKAQYEVIVTPNNHSEMEKLEAFRAIEKESFQRFVRAIRDWYFYHVRDGRKGHGSYERNCINNIYKQLFGFKAKQLRNHLGTKSGENVLDMMTIELVQILNDVFDELATLIRKDVRELTPQELLELASVVAHKYRKDNDLTLKIFLASNAA